MNDSLTHSVELMKYGEEVEGCVFEPLSIIGQNVFAMAGEIENPKILGYMRDFADSEEGVSCNIVFSQGFLETAGLSLEQAKALKFFPIVKFIDYDKNANGPSRIRKAYLVGIHAHTEKEPKIKSATIVNVEEAIDEPAPNEGFLN